MNESWRSVAWEGFWLLVCAGLFVAICAVAK